MHWANGSQVLRSSETERNAQTILDGLTPQQIHDDPALAEALTNHNRNGVIEKMIPSYIDALYRPNPPTPASRYARLKDLLRNHPELHAAEAARQEAAQKLSRYISSAPSEIKERIVEQISGRFAANGKPNENSYELRLLCTKMAEASSAAAKERSPEALGHRLLQLISPYETNGQMKPEASHSLAWQRNRDMLAGDERALAEWETRRNQDYVMRNADAEIEGLLEQHPHIDLTVQNERGYNAQALLEIHSLYHRSHLPAALDKYKAAQDARTTSQLKTDGVSAENHGGPQQPGGGPPKPPLQTRLEMV